MPTGSEDRNNYLIKAIETLKRQIIVIAEDYTILASQIKTDRKPGCSTEPLEGRSCYSALFKRSSPCINCPVVHVKRTNKPSLNHIHIDEDLYETSCLYAYPMPGNENRKNAIVVLDFHLPSLEVFDEKRYFSNAFLRNLIHSAVDGVVAADMTGKLIIFNQAAAEISGYTKEEALASLNIRNLYPEGDARIIMKSMREGTHGKKGTIKSYRQMALRKDGTLTPISLNASIVYEGNREVASIGFFHDMTETLRIQAELEKTQTQLLQAEKMSSLGKLAAGVAHQLNNPLGGITLFSQLMLEEHALSEDARSDLMRIKKDAERCSAIVKELLEFARQTKREVKLHNINKLIARTLFLLRNQSLFQNIIITEDYDATIPEIPADVQQLNHVFMNIILNAADAMEGKGRLEIKSRLDTESSRVVIQIADTGPGIPEEIMPNIFEPFFTTKEEGKGTGLGLSMAYGIVESHGGRLFATNKEKRGTLFTVELPLKQS
ncbi:MAG: ATP-binding protein [Pseudomonadota bacterium]